MKKKFKSQKNIQTKNVAPYRWMYTEIYTYNKQ